MMRRSRGKKGFRSKRSRLGSEFQGKENNLDVKVTSSINASTNNIVHIKKPRLEFQCSDEPDSAYESNEHAEP
ncbi:hypothetical protein N7453_001899 [Penicillium expansum]|nr:hypothetical protein N7453_001899 [Penicillium expansum]